MARVYRAMVCALAAGLLAVAGGSLDAAQETGIKVHGHWTIEVRNPDGTLVTHREFENALVPGAFGGSKALGEVFALKGVISSWWVVVDDRNIPHADPCEQEGARAQCVITTQVGAGGSPYTRFIFPTLTMQAATNGTNDVRLVLAGTATATFAGVINHALTQVQMCPATFSPGSDCSTGGQTFANFTEATLADVSVAAGQIIQVTVVISFS